MDARPDAVLYINHEFQFYKQGKQTDKAIQCKIPVQSFSVAPNGRFVVFVSAEDVRAEAGFLFRMDLNTGEVEKLSSKTIYFDHLELPDRELYAVPEISPDSRSAAFAVRAVGGNDGDDAIGLAGPVAVMDLASKNTRVLHKTHELHEASSAFVGAVLWSRDGRRLLLQLDDLGAIASVDGNDLKWLSSFMPKASPEGDAWPLAWWSDSEVLFQWFSQALGNDPPNNGADELFKLDLTTNSVKPAAELRTIRLGLGSHITGIELNERFLLIYRKDQAQLFTRAGQFVQSWPTANVRLYAE